MMVSNARKFVPPKDTVGPNVGRVRDPSGDEDMNAPLVEVPRSFPYLREIKNHRMVYPWSAAMAARSDLVEGYDPTTEREQALAVEAAMTKRTKNLSDSQIDRMIEMQIDAVNRFGQ